MSPDTRPATPGKVALYVCPTCGCWDALPGTCYGAPEKHEGSERQPVTYVRRHQPEPGKLEERPRPHEVNRVARAIFLSCWLLVGDDDDKLSSWEGRNHSGREPWRRMARAAISECRRPAQAPPGKVEDRLREMVEKGSREFDADFPHPLAYARAVLQGAGVPDLLAQLDDYERDFEDFRVAEGDRDEIVLALEDAGLYPDPDGAAIFDVVRRVLAHNDQLVEALGRMMEPEGAFPRRADYDFANEVLASARAAGLGGKDG